MEYEKDIGFNIDCHECYPRFIFVCIATGNVEALIGRDGVTGQNSPLPFLGKQTPPSRMHDPVCFQNAF